MENAGEIRKSYGAGFKPSSLSPSSSSQRVSPLHLRSHSPIRPRLRRFPSHGKVGTTTETAGLAKMIFEETLLSSLKVKTLMLKNVSK
jgi:hypothetical protein